MCKWKRSLSCDEHKRADSLWDVCFNTNIFYTVKLEKKSESCLFKLCYCHLMFTTITQANERFGQTLFNAVFDQLNCTLCLQTATVTSEGRNETKRSDHCVCYFICLTGKRQMICQATWSNLFLNESELCIQQQVFLFGCLTGVYLRHRTEVFS